MTVRVPTLFLMVPLVVVYLALCSYGYWRFQRFVLAKTEAWANRRWVVEQAELLKDTALIDE